MTTQQMVNIHEAKTHFSRLIQDVQDGSEVVIAKAGRPVAKLSAIAGEGERDRIRLRSPGSAKGKVWMAPDFDDPLPDFEPYSK